VSLNHQEQYGGPLTLQSAEVEHSSSTTLISEDVTQASLDRHGKCLGSKCVKSNIR
jgi:hypothetical protein